MMDNPLVAVQMITYNHAPYIEQAIDSVLAQKTNFEYKIFLFDDCSTDGTSAICKQYAEKYPDKIHLHIHSQNVGASENARAIHAATVKSSVKYLAPCEGDDYWTDPLKLQKQVDFLEANLSYSLCYHNIWFLDKGKFLLKNHIGSNQTKTIRDLMNGNIVNTVSAVVRISVVDFEEISKSGAVLCDYTLFLFAAMKGDMYYMKEPMAVYRYHPTSSWATQSVDLQLQGSIKILDSLKGVFSPEVNNLLRATRNRWVRFCLMDSLPNKVLFEKLYNEYVANEEGISTSLEKYKLELEEMKAKSTASTKLSLKDKLSGLAANLYDRMYLKIKGKWK